VLILAGLACAFAAIALILGFVVGERLGEFFAAIAAAGAAFEAVFFFWLLRRRK
jgi:hypothetical protein